MNKGITLFINGQESRKIFIFEVGSDQGKCINFFF